jgi:hypothetical protein
MTDYRYDVDSYLLRIGEEKAIMCHDTFDNYPDAMNCYKEFKSAINAELAQNEVKDWFVILSRIYPKGTSMHNEIIKNEGTI